LVLLGAVRLLEASVLQDDAGSVTDQHDDVENHINGTADRPRNSNLDLYSHALRDPLVDTDGSNKGDGRKKRKLEDDGDLSDDNMGVTGCRCDHSRKRGTGCTCGTACGTAGYCCHRSSGRMVSLDGSPSNVRDSQSVGS
jgi:hypothetical protein